MNSDTKVWYLKNYNCFKSITDEQIADIATSANMQEYTDTTLLYDPATVGEFVYIVKRGEVNLFHEKQGKKYIFDTLGVGSMFGDIAKKGEPLGHFAEGAPGTVVCTFTIEDFLRIVATYPSVMLCTLQEMSERLHEYADEVGAQQDTAKDLIVHELKRLHKKKQKAFLGLFEVPLRVTHQKLADLTGLNRVTITRILKELKEEGVITINSETGVINLM
jgi:CRP/FNR family transcriptional regulator, cyclic AMP receptor protein